MARARPLQLFPRLVLATLLTALAGGCADNVRSPFGSDIPTITAAPQAADRLHQQADDALARWAAAVRDSGGASITFTGDMTSQIGTWTAAAKENNEAALQAGMLVQTDLSEDRPGRREVKWVDGTKIDVDVLSARQAFDALVGSANADCAGCEPIRVTGANLATALVETSTGPAEVPTWVFSVRGSDVRITRVAVDPSVTVDPPPWDADDPPAGLSIVSARGTPASRTLEVDYVGMDERCGLVHETDTVESDLAVVVIVDERPGPDGAQPCPPAPGLLSAKLTLEAALGDRVVLEGRQGLPVPVRAP